MKFFAIFLSFFCSTALFAFDPPIQKELKAHKIRVDISEICFQADGMYYCWNGSTFEISSLEFENGEYRIILSNDIIEKIFGIWYCKHCNRMNSKYDTACYYCKRPK